METDGNSGILWYNPNGIIYICGVRYRESEVQMMKCPRCGKELRISKKNPNYGLCDNCKKKFDIDNYKLDYLYDAEQKKNKIIKQNRGCAIFMIVFLALVSIIIAIAITSGGDKDTSVTLKTSTKSVNYEDTLQSQETALNDLISKYESGEESAETSVERLDGLANGIQNTIDMLNNNNESNELISYATALKGIATHYSRYITTGDQSEMDDVNALRESIK